MYNMCFLYPCAPSFVRYNTNTGNVGNMVKLTGKVCENPVPYLIIVGIVISAFVYRSLLNYADEGNLIMVILMAVAVAFIALVITKVIRYYQIKEL